MISVLKPMMTAPSTATTSYCAGNVYHDPQYSDNHIAGPNGTLTHPLYSTIMIKAYNDQYTKSTLCNELPPEWTMLAAVLHMRNCT